MTVKDLLEELKKMPQDYKIVVTGVYGSDASDIYVRVATPEDRLPYDGPAVLLMTDLMTG